MDAGNGVRGARTRGPLSPFNSEDHGRHSARLWQELWHKRVVEEPAQLCRALHSAAEKVKDACPLRGRDVRVDAPTHARQDIE